MIFKDWVADGSKKKKSKDFQNMSHKPLIKGDPETVILETIVPPELHLTLGMLLYRYIVFHINCHCQSRCN